MQVQLENVCASVVSMQGCPEQIDQALAQLTAQEEKIMNLARLVNLSQTHQER
jgi:hypothetical protein